MTYLNHIFLIIAVSMLVSSCKHQENSDRYSKETTQFNSYLQQYFETKIPSDTSYYVLVSSKGCSGCIKMFVKLLTSPATKSKVHFIVSSNLLIKENLDPGLLSKVVMIDTANKVDRLPYHKGNIAVMETANEKIFNYYNVEPYQTDSVLSVLK